ncbi:uncharacterized protein isoform X2 [Leptinotarsa decemlineata]|uniref:uncharacterized protein isoform X2 n=1 Tax=Leptinotarsa decemlineata TaxID=7539 RepID=UPI003D30B9C0
MFVSLSNLSNHINIYSSFKIVVNIFQMYKLLSRSLPKCNKSLTKFTTIYKKILSVCHASTSHQKKNAPKSHSTNTEENSQRSSKKNEITFKTSRTFSSSCVGKTGLKFLKKSLFPEKCNRKVKFLMFSTSSKFCYSSTANQAKENNKKYFKNHRALELYKKAFEQCMRIKHKKQRVDRAHNIIGWTPEPFKIRYPHELVVIADEEKAEKSNSKRSNNNKIMIEEKTPKQVLRLIPKKSLTIKEMAQKRKVLEKKKMTSKNNKKALKIVYPTHIIKHKLGLTPSYHIDKSVRKKIEKMSNAKFREEQKPKPRVQINTIEIIPYKQELDQNLLKVISAIKKRREKICEKNAKTEDSIKHLISQHPMVKKATKTAKMSINQKYNVILLKSQAKVQLKMLKPKELVEDNDAVGERCGEPDKVLSAGDNVNKIEKNQETPVIPLHHLARNSKITQHPILPSDTQRDMKQMIRYPKRLLVEKSETFDVDGICLKTKESYVAYVDEIGDIPKKIPTFQEKVYTHPIEKQDEAVSDHKKINYQNSEKQNDALTDKSDRIAKHDNNCVAQNLLKYQLSQGGKKDTEDVQDVGHTENQSKIVNPAESLREYLKKLNELKNQTSISRLSIANYPIRTSSMVENLSLKKINVNENKNIKSKEIEGKEKVQELLTKNVEKNDDKNKTDNLLKSKGTNKIDENIKHVDKKLEFIKPAEEKMRTVKNLDNINSTSFKLEEINSDKAAENRSSEVKPLFKKLLDHDREQVSANERKKFTLIPDEETLRKKSEAKAKVIIPKFRSTPERTSTRSPVIKNAPKYSLENFQPDDALSEKVSESENERKAYLQNKIYKKILEQYEVRSKSDMHMGNKKSSQNEQKSIEQTTKNIVDPEKRFSSKNILNSSSDIHEGNSSKTELRVHSIEVERQNDPVKDLTTSTETHSKNAYPKQTPQLNQIDYIKSHSEESKYKEKVKNILEPSSQYLEKLKEAGKNQMRNLGELQAQLTNQLSENMARSLKIEKMIENATKVENNITNENESIKLSEKAVQLGIEEGSKRNETTVKHPNQLTSRTGEVQISPNDFSTREAEVTQNEKYKYLLDTNKNIETDGDISKSEYSEENTQAVPSSKSNKYSLEQSLNEHSNKDNENFKYSEQLVEVNNGIVSENNVAVKETFLYILKEKDPEQDDIVTDIVEMKNKLDSKNISKILKEEPEYNHLLDSFKNLLDVSEDFVSRHGRMKDSHSANHLQNKGTSHQVIQSQEKPLNSHEPSRIQSSAALNRLDISNPTEEHQPPIRKEVFLQPPKHSESEVDEFQKDQVVENSSEENTKFQYNQDVFQTSIHLNNRPSIRKENPPINKPKPRNEKKDKPKSKKDLVFPPPKTGDTPKMVEGNSMIEETEKKTEESFSSGEFKRKYRNSIYEQMGKDDLEDIVFGYRYKPKHDWTKGLKNWITILAFIEELKITYKDGSDENLIKISEEFEHTAENMTSNKLEFAKIVPIEDLDDPPQKNCEIMEKTYPKEQKTDYEKLSEKPVPKSKEVDENTIENNICTAKNEEIRNDESTISKQSRSSVSLDLPQTAEKVMFIERNHQNERDDSKMCLEKGTIVDRKVHQKKHDLEETVSTKLRKGTDESKELKWPPKLLKLKFPQNRKQSEELPLEQKIVVDKVSQPKLSQKKVWSARNPQNNSKRIGFTKENVSSNMKISVDESIPVKTPVSNLLEKNLKHFKTINQRPTQVLPPKNCLMSMTKTDALKSKTDSCLLRTFLLDDDENFEGNTEKTEFKKNLKKYTLTSKIHTEQYSKNKKSDHNRFSRQLADISEDSKSPEIIKHQAETSANHSESKPPQYSKTMSSKLGLPTKHSRKEQRSISLESNLKSWKLLKSENLGTSDRKTENNSTKENYSIKSSPLSKMFSLDENDPDEYDKPLKEPMKTSKLLKMFSLDENDPEEIRKPLKRANTLLLPTFEETSYLGQRKLRQQCKNSSKSTDKNQCKKNADVKLKTAKTNMNEPDPDKKKHFTTLQQDLNLSKKLSETSESNKLKKSTSFTPARLQENILGSKLSAKSSLLTSYDSFENTKNSSSNKKKNFTDENKQSKRPKSLEVLNVIENTTDCFSLCFRKNKKKSKTAEIVPKCVVRLTLPKTTSEHFKMEETNRKYNVHKKGFVDNVFDTERSNNQTKINKLECVSSSQGMFRGQEKNGDHETYLGGNNGDSRGKKSSKLLLKVILPKNPYAPGKKVVADDNQKKSDPKAPKIGPLPGKLKNKAIIRINKTFGVSEKFQHNNTALEPNIKKVSKYVNKSLRTLNSPSSSKNLKSAKSYSNRLDEPNQKHVRQDIINSTAEEERTKELKDESLKEIYGSVYLEMIMEKYRVNNKKLEDLSDQNMVLNEIKIFQRKKSKERIIQLFDRNLRKNNRNSRKKKDKRNMGKKLDSVENERPSSIYKIQKIELTTSKTKSDNVKQDTKALETGNLRKNLSQFGRSTEHIENNNETKKLQRNQRKYKLEIDSGLKLEDSTKRFHQHNISVPNPEKKTEKVSKNTKYGIFSPRYCLEYLVDEKEKKVGSQKILSHLTKAKKIQKSKQKPYGNFGNYHSENQFKNKKYHKQPNTQKAILRKVPSKKSNNLEENLELHERPFMELERKKHLVKKPISITKLSEKGQNSLEKISNEYIYNQKSTNKPALKEMNLKAKSFGKEGEKNSSKYLLERSLSSLGKEGDKYWNKYFLERSLSSQCLDYVKSKEMNNRNDSASSTEKHSIVRPSSSKYLLEKQVSIPRINLNLDTLLNDSKKNKSAPEIKNLIGKWGKTMTKLVEKNNIRKARAKIQEMFPKINVVMDPVDFGERIIGTDLSCIFSNKDSGPHNYTEQNVVAKIEHILDKRVKNGKFDRKEMKSEIASRDQLISDQQQSIQKEAKPLIYKQKQNLVRISDNKKTENNKVVSRQLTPKVTSTLVIEKVLPVYPPIESKTAKSPTTKFCYQIQIPPQSIMQVLFSQPRFDVTTLTDELRREVVPVPKKSNAKYRNLKITYIRVKTGKPAKYDESFLPALMSKKSERTSENDDKNKETHKEQILKMRYELLKKLREEFEFLNNEQVNQTEKNDNKSEFGFKLTESKDIEGEKFPKNNTELLIKKLSEKDMAGKKDKPKNSDDDPKRK